MKIAVTAKSKNLEAEVDPRFGRCSYFIIIDKDTMNFEAISNQSAMTSGGAGIQAAQNIVKTGVKIVVTGNMGPNAFQTLSAAGIMVFTGANGTVKEAFEKYKSGDLKQSNTPNVDSHSGMKAIGKGFRGG